MRDQRYAVRESDRRRERLISGRLLQRWRWHSLLTGLLHGLVVPTACALVVLGFFSVQEFRTYAELGGTPGRFTTQTCGVEVRSTTDGSGFNGATTKVHACYGTFVSQDGSFTVRHLEVDGSAPGVVIEMRRTPFGDVVRPEVAHASGYLGVAIGALGGAVSSVWWLLRQLLRLSADGRRWAGGRTGWILSNLWMGYSPLVALLALVWLFNLPS
jgi:hypothetical protein